MTFKNLAYFSVNDNGTDFMNGATFANNGVMNFESSAVFQLLKNVNNGILNFNAGMGGDTRYTTVMGNIHNSATINVNGQIRFTAKKEDEGFKGYRIINYSGGTFNVKGKTQIEQVVWNMGKFYIYNETEFKEAFYNYVDTTTQRLALFVIESPTTFTYWLRNERGATLIIKSPTVINRYLDNFLSAITEIRGTTLTTTDGVWNYESGIFIFSALNGQMGQLIGHFTNQDNKGQNEGKVKVNVRGLSAGTKYQIINGSTILLNEKDIEFINGTGQYLGNGWIWIDEALALKTPIIATNKANVATMNNMFLASNAVMSAHHKNTKFRKMANRNDRAHNALVFSKIRNNAKSYRHYKHDSAKNPQSEFLDSSLTSFAKNNSIEQDLYDFVALDSLKSNESFFYNSQDLAKNSVNLTKNHSNLTTNLNAKSTDLANPNDNFFFLLTPFVNHTSFKAMGDYQISGLDYGFISAFGGKVSKNHTLGTHFALDYANLGDKNDKSVKITNLNLMAGLNYRADLIYAMYLKARGDFYYFLNSADSSEMTTAKPNNLGFGLSVAFGKDFDFKQGGILGIELGLDYKAFHTSKVSANDIWGNASDEYKSAFYHLLYLDLGLNYYKYFSIDSGLWGIDAGFGIRGNLTPNVSNGTLMVANRAVDITLDNDNMLGYVSLGGSYVLEAQRFDMEFTLRYI